MNARTPMQQPHTPPRRNAEAGFSLVELMLSLGLVVITLVLLQSTLFSAVKNRVATAEQDHRNAHAYDLIQRMTAIPFGKHGDPAATGAQLTELFDDDQDLGSATLKSLETAPGTPGHSFTTVFDGVATPWRVLITADLDGDGKTTSFREGRQDLLQIEVYALDRLMFKTSRAADFPNTRRD